MKFKPCGYLVLFRDSWETLSVSLSASAPNGTISKDLVSNAILNEELRCGCSIDVGQGVSNNDTPSYDMKKVSKKKPKPKFTKSKSKDKRDDQCHYCDKLGH
ncbi:hypothetical protein LIER_33429 [Lithospermum erythrorhizon]|uniref:Uncharacterized protein n=1 Tax=Lithospermum erythrorhizon TaxID=34254 RepID=A0AAV3RWN4_LITER